jgi:hypothetical protein
MLPSASPNRGMIADEEEMMQLLEMLASLSETFETSPEREQQNLFASSPINPTDVSFGPAGEPGAPTPETPEWLLELVDRLSSQEFQSWMEPFEGVSQAIGGAIRGENPLAAAARIGGPTTSDALTEKGAPDWLALLSEFLVPDPFGASKVADLIPLLGFVSPRIMARLGRGEIAESAIDAVRSRGDSMGGSNAFEKALTESEQDLFKGKLIPGGTEGPDVDFADSKIMLTGTKKTPTKGTLLNAVLRRIDDTTYNIEFMENRGTPGDPDFLESMDYIMRLADETGVTLLNTPSGSGRLDDTELFDMYSKLGFQTNFDYFNEPTGEMTRKPFNPNASQEANFAELTTRRQQEKANYQWYDQDRERRIAELTANPSAPVDPNIGQLENFDTLLETIGRNYNEVLGTSREEFLREKANLMGYLEDNGNALTARNIRGELSGADLWEELEKVAPSLVLTPDDAWEILYAWPIQHNF